MQTFILVIMVFTAQGDWLKNENRQLVFSSSHTAFNYLGKSSMLWWSRENELTENTRYWTMYQGYGGYEVHSGSDIVKSK